MNWITVAKLILKGLPYGLLIGALIYAWQLGRQVEIDRQEKASLQEAVRIYSQQWEDEIERRRILDEELRAARANVVRAERKVAKHDFDKIYQRKPERLLDIVNRNTRRLLDEIRQAANATEEAPAAGAD